LERTLSPFTLPPLTDDGDDGDDDDDDDDAIRTAVGRPPSGQRRFSSLFYITVFIQKINRTSASYQRAISGMHEHKILVECKLYNH
jgi:hypothetical protein